jgi:carbon-monoxide dehydrogenase large subunit
VSAQEGVTLRLEPSGNVRLLTSVTDQGQGTLAGLVQVVAATLGVGVDAILPLAGDSGVTPYGGGAWASRGIALGGEAGRLAALELKTRLLAATAALHGCDAAGLELRDGRIVTGDGTLLTTLAELSATLHFRQHTLPPGVAGEYLVTRHFVPHVQRHFLANGIQASHLEVDVETGLVRLLGHWVVEDCGRIVNPLLVDEQIRGGVVQGIGAALYEHCRYDTFGQLLNASLADYSVPLASEMPDIDVAHVASLEPGSGLGAKGLGEAGTLGAPAAIWTALNDALRPLGARAWRQPFTPAHLLEELAAAGH